MCKILANMTQVSDVAPGPLVLINFSDIEMKLGKVAYNNELQIKFELHCY
jgi:hypothetical protein